MEALQRVEHAVWRQVVRAPSYVAFEALQGEIGCSTFIGRDIKSKLGYVSYIKRGICGLVQKIMDLRLQDKKAQWTKLVNMYMKRINKNVESLSKLKKEIKKLIHRWGTNE